MLLVNLRVYKGLKGLQTETGQQAIVPLYASVETNIALFKHAETWGGKKLKLLAVKLS